MESRSATPAQQAYLDSITDERPRSAPIMPSTSYKPSSASKILRFLTAAEQKHKSREGRNEELKEQEKQQDRQRKAVSRAMETSPQENERLMNMQLTKYTHRMDMESDEQRNHRQMESRQRMADNRSMETSSQRCDRIINMQLRNYTHGIDT